MTKLKRRPKIQVLTNEQVIRPNELPTFAFAGTAGSTPPNFNSNAPPIAEFNMGETSTNIPQPMPAIDFNKELYKDQQRRQVADHIAAETLKRENEVKKEAQPEILVNEPRVDVEAPIDSQYKWSREYLPSRGLLGREFIFIRPFDVPDIIKLHTVRGSNNQSALFDIIGSCLYDCDVRDLTLGDFRFVFYWLKLNSFTRNPFIVRWTSKYGNENKITLKQSDLVITPLKMDPDDVEYFTSKGFCIPTLRDGEEIARHRERLISEHKTKWGESKPEIIEKTLREFDYESGYFQFMQGKSIAEKQAKFKNPSMMTPDDMVEILEFSNMLNFGVVEQMTVTDKNFNADDAIVYLTKSLETLEQLQLNEIDNDELRNILLQNMQDIKAEIARIDTSISNTGEAAATSETVTFSLSLDDFFPENIVNRTRVG